MLLDKNDKEVQDDYRITKYPHKENIPFIKYFDDITDSIEELKKIYKKLTKNN